MSRIKRIILNPATPREARTAAERLVRSLDLRATTTSEYSAGALITSVWTCTAADADQLARATRTLHVRAETEITDTNAVVITWKKP